MPRVLTTVRLQLTHAGAMNTIRSIAVIRIAVIKFEYTSVIKFEYTIILYLVSSR